MPTTTDTSRTARLLALMKQGDDAFNARDFAAVNEVHHPDMIAYITGFADLIYGRDAHAAAMQQLLRIFPDMHVYSDPYPIQFGSGDWITVVTNATGTFTGDATAPQRPRCSLGGDQAPWRSGAANRPSGSATTVAAHCSVRSPRRRQRKSARKSVFVHWDDLTPVRLWIGMDRHVL